MHSVELNNQPEMNNQRALRDGDFIPGVGDLHQRWVDDRASETRTLGKQDKRTTTSGQLKIHNLSSGVKMCAKTTNQGLVVEYMDRAQGPTQDFFTQNLSVTLA